MLPGCAPAEPGPGPAPGSIGLCLRVKHRDSEKRPDLESGDRESGRAPQLPCLMFVVLSVFSSLASVCLHIKWGWWFLPCFPHRVVGR